MKSLLLILACIGPLAAEPPQAEGIQAGPIQVEGESVNDQQARLRACWECLSGDSAQQFWRATLEERKWQLQWEHRQNLGEFEAEAEWEREWQDHLERTRAQLALRVPEEEFEVSVQTEWTGVLAEANWTTQLKGKLLGNWRAQAALQQATSQTQMRLTLTDGVDQLEAERRVSPQEVSYRGKVIHRLGPGSLELEATRRWGEGWQKQWAASYRCKFSQYAQWSTQGSRRWSQQTGDWQDMVEAELQLHW